jgi:hypothetical protein
MRKAFLVILILLSFQKINAQTNENIISQLISELLDCSSKVDDTLFFDQHISTTFFHDDSISFKKKTGLEVPQKTLAEIISNSKKINSDNKWKEDELNKKIIVVSRMNDTALISGKPYIKCLSEKQLDDVSKNLPTLSIYSISKLIFSNNRQTAVFHLSFGKAGTGFFSFESIFISKVFGKWVIIQRFDWGMS